MDEKFAESVRKHTELEQRKLSPHIVEARRDWWKNEIKDLFSQVESWLDILIEKRLVTFETRDAKIHEEFLGLYTVPSALIKLGNETLEMLPVGTFILGSFGRIDLKGPNGQLMLILQGHVGTEELIPTDSRWTIVKRDDSRRTQFDLTETTFEQLFADLFGINAL
jgi:hypothetical protein